MAILFAPYFRATDQSNAPIPGAFAAFYATTTSTPQPIYADAALSIALSNPIQSDSNGVFPQIWLDDSLPAYKVILLYPDQNNPLIPGAVVPGARGTIDPYNAAFDVAAFVAQFWPQTQPQTQTEINLGVTPTHYQYPATPYVDPRRYGASTASTDNQTALQTALNVAYASKSALWLPEMYITSPLSLTMTGSGTQPLRIFGSSVIGSGIQAKTGLSSTALLTFTNGNPAGFPIEAFLVIENISIVSTAKVTGVHGLSIKGLGDWRLSGVRISLFDHGLDLLYALTAVCDQECEFIQCNKGVVVAVDGSLSIGTSGTPNMLQFENCHISLNTNRGIEFNGGTSLQVIGCDIESNGTGGDVTTGGVFILGQTSADALEGHIIIERNWFEANSGWSLNVAAQTNGCVNRLGIRSNEFVGAESGRNILISGADSVLIEDQQSASVGDLYNITATKATFINCSVNAGFTINVTYPVFLNCASGGGPNSTFGVQAQATLTYTGCTAAVTNLVNIYQQGPLVTLIFTDVQGTSNATSFTMTGLPAKYQPISTWYLPVVVQDNGVDSMQFVTLSSGSGTLTFTKGGSTTGFTNTVLKGVRRMKIDYRLDI